MPPQSAELKVNDQPNCPPTASSLCGFEEGMVVIIFDTSGQLRHVHDHAGAGLARPPAASRAGPELQRTRPARRSRRSSATRYYLDRTTNQLMRYDGGSERRCRSSTTSSICSSSYFGDPNPPTGAEAAAGEANCLYDAAGNYVGPADARRRPTDRWRR